MHRAQFSRSLLLHITYETRIFHKLLWNCYCFGGVTHFNGEVEGKDYEKFNLRRFVITDFIEIGLVERDGENNKISKHPKRINCRERRANPSFM